MGMFRSSACTVSSVSISNPDEETGKDLTNRLENTLYPESMSPAGRPNIRVTIPASIALPNTCPRRNEPSSSDWRAAFTTSNPSSVTMRTMAPAADAS
jgi:hypothetical protein